MDNLNLKGSTFSYTPCITIPITYKCKTLQQIVHLDIQFINSHAVPKMHGKHRQNITVSSYYTAYLLY